MDENLPQNQADSGKKRILLTAIGAVLLIVGLIELLGAISKLGGDNLSQSVAATVVAAVFGGALPAVVGVYLLYRGLARNS